MTWLWLMFLALVAIVALIQYALWRNLLPRAVIILLAGFLILCVCSMWIVWLVALDQIHVSLLTSVAAMWDLDSLTHDSSVYHHTHPGNTDKTLGTLVVGFVLMILYYPGIVVLAVLMLATPVALVAGSVVTVFGGLRTMGALGEDTRHLQIGLLWLLYGLIAFLSVRVLVWLLSFFSW